MANTEVNLAQKGYIHQRWLLRRLQLQERGRSPSQLPLLLYSLVQSAATQAPDPQIDDQSITAIGTQTRLTAK
jgi:hypothetical protein